MGRPKLKEKEKKARLGITISKELNKLLGIETSNKSGFIENLVKKYFNNQSNAGE